MAVEAREQVKNQVAIYSCHTLKPFDHNRLKKIFKKYNKIVTLEIDHSQIGGLGEIVKKFAFDYNFDGKVINFALRDQFKHLYGSQQDLLNFHGISLNKIKNSLK